MTQLPAWLRFALLSPSVAAVLFVACSSDEQNTDGSGASGEPTSSGAAGPSAGGSGTAGAGTGASIEFDAGDRDGSLTRDSACASSSAEATLEKKPIDIIIVIDNSGSMGDDIQAVETNINANFATIIGASGIDYRVIMVADHGAWDPGDSICVAAPLSSTNCMPIPAQPAMNPPIFFHYSTEIASHDSLCKMVSAFDGTLPDDYGLAPLGWSEWLRPESFKVFLEITDDGVSCGAFNDGNNVAGGDAVAAAFDTALLALSPMHFGDAMNRNYVWHSILGMPANVPASAAWLAADPVQLGECPTGVDPGTGYQSLSILTGGLRFPICEHASYDAVFQEIAVGIIAGAKIACEFPVPEPPQGETIDLSTVVVEYTPGGGGNPQKLTQVADLAACGPDSFYIEAGTIKLCPETCTVVQDDADAKMLVLFDCEDGPR
jgi:hypothetical protein